MKPRLRRTITSRFLTAALSLVIGACTLNIAEQLPTHEQTGDTSGGPAEPLGFLVSNVPARAVDVLLVVDDGWTMSDVQRTLGERWGAVAQLLEAPGVEADYRVAVVSTSVSHPACLGTAPNEAGMFRATSCVGRLDAFAVAENGLGQADDQAQAGCQSRCTAPDIPLWSLTNGQPAAAWIERDRGRFNFDATQYSAAQVLSCVVPQGIAGCGFASPLEAMLTALTRTQDPTSPAYGFLRRHAVLSIVFVTDKFDCSINPGAAKALSPEGLLWQENTHGYAAQSMCWHAGVECTGDGNPWDECHAVNRDGAGNVLERDLPERQPVLHPLGRYIDFLAEIRRSKATVDPRTAVHVALVAGVPVDYPDGAALRYATAPAGDPDGMAVAPGCTGPGGEVALPPVRLREFAEAFQVDARPNVFSICEPDFARVLAPTIEAVVANGDRPVCYPGCVADGDGSTAPVEPECVVHWQGPDGELHTVSECVRDGRGEYLWQVGEYVPPPGESVCVAYRVDQDGTTADVHDDLDGRCGEERANLELAFRYAADHPPAGSGFWARCVASEDAARDCGE